MVNLERLGFLTNKLHELLSQAEELKQMLEERNAPNQTPSSDTSSDESAVSDKEIDEQEPEPQPEVSTWCCCFTRKLKLN
jgi:hypothetical protein